MEVWSAFPARLLVDRNQDFDTRHSIPPAASRVLEPAADAFAAAEFILRSGELLPRE